MRKNISKVLVIGLIVMVCSILVHQVSYADNSNLFFSNMMESRNTYISYVSCDIDISDNGELFTVGLCDAIDNKTIYGKLYVQRKSWFGWKTIETFEETGYSGELIMDESLDLSKKGKYRVKLVVTCEGEKSTSYSSVMKYE